MEVSDRMRDAPSTSQRTMTGKSPGYPKGKPLAAENVIGFEHLSMGDVERVGGKNASLGEMIRHLREAGVQVPGGFATTAAAYREFLSHEGLDQRLHGWLAALDVDDVRALADTGKRIREAVLQAPFPVALERDVRGAYARLVDGAGAELSVAVRSSATAEDLPDASFAGQQETFLNVTGIETVLTRIKEVFASLFNDRAIAYRVHHGFDHAQVALSAGIQRMVRSDLAASGVIFTMDTESGFRDAVFITASYGLGEAVVQGAVNPDEFTVFKPTLAAGHRAVLRRKLGAKELKMIYAEGGERTSTTNVATSPEERERYCVSDAEVLLLAEQATAVERHYSARAGAPRPMDAIWRAGASSAWRRMRMPVASSPSCFSCSRRTASIARSSARPPPGTMPSAIAAFVELIASSNASLRLLSSVSDAAPTRITATPPASLARRSSSFSRS